MLISLTQDCYVALTKIREEMREEKRKKGVPDKTTFSEIVCMFINKYQMPMTKNEEGRNSPHLPSPPNLKEMIQNEN